ERPTIVEFKPPEENGVISLTDEIDELDNVRVEISKDDPLEFLMFPNPIMDRKCLLDATRNNFLQHRVQVLKLLDRNAFRLEVSLFLKLLVRQDQYRYFGSHYGLKKMRLKKILERESCLPQTKESPNPQLRLTL
ncbi:MAG: hypothetical protein R3250_14730, partial [Melioribacteraceae bacterium]|nr:hypothetical protein [Melioribacteraceae bacterium]